MIAGGGVYDNLDYSFTVGHEDGTAAIEAPGGGGRVLHEQLAILVRFMYALDFARMRPDNAAIGALPEGTTARALVEVGQAYAVYLQSALSGERCTEMGLDLPRGRYRAEWVNAQTGDVDRADVFQHAGGMRRLGVPTYDQDIALRVHRIEPLGARD
jgi:hypothetical protein